MKLLSQIFRFITKHKILSAVVLIILLFVVWRTFLTKPSNQQLTLYTVKTQNIQSSVSASGTLDGKDQADLKFTSGGTLAFIKVKQGDMVKKGELIAGLDTTQLNIALAQAENNLKSSQATLQKVLNDIHLFQYGNGGFSNVGSANETETQREERIAAQTAVGNAQESVNAAKNNLQNAILISPINGIVTQAISVSGQNVSPTDLIAEIVNKSSVYFDAQVDESDIGKVKIGQKAQVTLNAYGDKIFNGTVKEITPITETDSTGATVVVVKIDLGQPNINFVSGLNGQATIIINEANNVLTVPIQSIRDDGTVILKTDQGLKPVKVTQGIASDTDVQITSGLKANDVIVENPSGVVISQPNFLSRLFNK